MQWFAGVAASFVFVLLSGCTSDGQAGASNSRLPVVLENAVPAMEPTEAPVEAPAPTLTAEVSITGRVPNDPYLPGAIPDGFVLESVTWFDSPEEIRPPDWIDADAITLGDSAVLSDTSVQITARRFGSEEDLRHARWIEDALMVQGGGPSQGVYVEGSLFLYDPFVGPGGKPIGGQFHATIGDVLVTGLIFGDLSTDELSELLASLLIGDEDEVMIDIDPDAAGLLELEHARPDANGESAYELAYSNGSERFSVMVVPGAPESSVALGSVSRAGERFDGENGSGFVEAQPEVGSALGSRRLIWWVPTTRLQVWFGSTLQDQQAVTVADSFVEVDALEWQQALEGVEVSSVDFGPMNLPEDPEAKYEERLAEDNRTAGDLGSRPDVDVAKILDYVADFRGGTDPLTGGIEWVGPVEMDALTSSVNFFPRDADQAFRALQLIRPSDHSPAAAEARRQDIRGLCCGQESITLVEGMEHDEAAVVAAHELTHLYDTTMLDMRFPASTELFSAATALREGNANRVMIAYRDEFGLRYLPENRPHLQLDIPIALRRALRFVYLDGQAFAEALAADGGEAAVDRALVSNPPLSTEHILHPDAYLAGDTPVAVAAPDPPADAIADQRSTLGALVIALVAEDELGWQGAVELAGEWAGDGFVAWTDGGLHCLAATVEFDNPAAANVFVDLAPGEASAAGPVVDLMSCG